MATFTNRATLSYNGRTVDSNTVTGTFLQTLSITIYSMVKKRVSPEINALSTILFVVVLMVLLFTNVRSIKKERAKEKKMMKI